MTGCKPTHVVTRVHTPDLSIQHPLACPCQIPLPKLLCGADRVGRFASYDAALAPCHDAPLPIRPGVHAHAMSSLHATNTAGQSMNHGV